jgi:hypothetical protein
VLTLYERGADGAAAYVGDARLATFPASEQRLLSYAVDTKLRVDRETGDTNLIAGASVSDGVLRLTRKLRRTTTYRLIGPAQEARKLILEQPRSNGWSLVEPDPSGVAMTPGAYRIPVELEAGEARTVTVTVEYPQLETSRILDLDDSRLGALIAARELDPKLRGAFSGIVQRRQALAALTAQLKSLQAERDSVTQDQARVRENLAAVGKGTPLYNRLVDKLSQQESRLDTLAPAIAAANAEIDKATAALTDYIGKLTL